MGGVKIKTSILAAFTATVLTASLFVFLFFYIGISYRRYTYEDSKTIARNISFKEASDVEIYLTSALMTARSLEQKAMIYRKYHATRDEIKDMLYTTVERNPNYMTAWTMWEPNAYDGRDKFFRNDSVYDENGSMALTFYRYNDSIYSERNVPGDYNDDYYTLPRSLKKEMIIDPFYYKYDNTGYLVFETSAVFPVIEDSVFLGLFAVDINLENLQKKLGKIRLYETGFLSLLTSSGKIVSHIDSSLVNTDFFSSLAPGDSIKYIPFTEGKELNMETTSQYTGNKVFRFFYPISVGKEAKPWSLMIEIPIDKATIRSKQLWHIAIGTLVTGMFLFIYLIINIFERKRYEKSLIDAMLKVEDSKRIISESERRFREMNELLPLSVFETDLSGKITYVNKTGLETYRLTDADIENGINLISTIADNDKQIAAERVKTTLNEESIQSRFYTALRKDGSMFPVQIYSRSFREDNVLKGIRGVIIDITERIKAEEQIRKNEARLLKSQTIGHFGYSEQVINSNSVWASAEAMKIFGFSPSDGYVTITEIMACIEDMVPFRTAYFDLIEKGKRFDLEFTIKPADGSSQRWVHAISELDKDENGKPVIVGSTFQDITEKKVIEKELETYRNSLELIVNERTEELAAANEELTATNDELMSQRVELEQTMESLQAAQKQLIQSEKMASLGVLAAGVAHEINNPLNFIQGGILGIECYFVDNFPEHLKNVSVLINAINTGVSRSANIVTSLSHYSRKDDLVHSECNINFIIDNCLIMLENKLKDKIEIIKNYTVAPYLLKGSEGKLHQAFLNILSNACQSIENNGTINISTTVEGNELVLTFGDTGCGIKQDNIGKIFDPFFTTKGPGKGTGLGLSITYKIIQEHNGSIEIKSEPGRGTEVIIMLPVNNTIDRE